jgi:hypothetical protein
MNYTIQYRRRVAATDLARLEMQWDVLLSAFNPTGRVRNAFRDLSAEEKLWLVQSEYEFTADELPMDDAIYMAEDERETTVVKGLLDRVGNLQGKRLVVDITGFMRHTLLVLVHRLFDSGMDRFWLVYSDPGRYRMNEATQFSKGGVKEVRQVPGYFGSRDAGDIESDILVLGTGYDVDMMRAVVEDKRRASRFDVFGLPSLQPAMYQENVLSVALLDEGYEASNIERLYAGANDPFATAQVLHDTFADDLKSGKIGSLYLAPTGTKVQALGFALFYLSECRDLPASIILPLPVRYAKETTSGHSRTWIYEVDLRLLRPSV